MGQRPIPEMTSQTVLQGLVVEKPINANPRLKN